MNNEQPFQADNWTEESFTKHVGAQSFVDAINVTLRANFEHCVAREENHNTIKRQAKEIAALHESEAAGTHREIAQEASLASTREMCATLTAQLDAARKDTVRLEKLCRVLTIGKNDEVITAYDEALYELRNEKELRREDYRVLIRDWRQQAEMNASERDAARRERDEAATSQTNQAILHAEVRKELDAEIDALRAELGAKTAELGRVTRAARTIINCLVASDQKPSEIELRAALSSLGEAALDKNELTALAQLASAQRQTAMDTECIERITKHGLELEAQLADLRAQLDASTKVLGLLQSVHECQVASLTQCNESLNVELADWQQKHSDEADRRDNMEKAVVEAIKLREAAEKRAVDANTMAAQVIGERDYEIRQREKMQDKLAGAQSNAYKAYECAKEADERAEAAEKRLAQCVAAPVGRASRGS